MITRKRKASPPLMRESVDDSVSDSRVYAQGTLSADADGGRVQESVTAEFLYSLHARLRECPERPGGGLPRLRHVSSLDERRQHLFQRILDGVLRSLPGSDSTHGRALHRWGPLFESRDGWLDERDLP
jgi:hypothetical protein